MVLIKFWELFILFCFYKHLGSFYTYLSHSVPPLSVLFLYLSVKNLLYPTANESLSLHYGDTFAFCQREIKFRFIVPIPPAPSFRLLVPHSLHSEAFGTLRKSNSFISLNHPKPG